MAQIENQKVALRGGPFPVKVLVPDMVYHKCIEHAQKASIGGTSHVRNTDQRKSSLFDDQLTGQVTMAAASFYLFGSWEKWIEERERANRTPFKGDGGTDFLGTNFDVKGSRMRYGSDPMAYRLIVRPAEAHASSMYILALCGNTDPWNVCLVGCMPGSELVKIEQQKTGAFAGAIVVQATDLYAIERLWRINPVST